MERTTERSTAIAGRGWATVTATAFDLHGSVAVVTGGGRGIGRAIALGLADAGADVVPTARTASEVDSTVSAIRSRGRRSISVTTDVTDDSDVAELFDRTVAELGGLDIVVNNAGINPPSALGLPETVTVDGFDETIEVNLRGAFTCATVAVEHLQERGGGCVINVASVGGLVGLPRQHPYVAAKHGLVGLTRSMAIDWAPEIRVNAIAPGYVRTDLTAEIESDDRLEAAIRRQIPVDRFAEPEEMAGPAVFLASDAARYVTGAVIPVDGGWTAR